jgi:hypothetical protein
MPVAEARVALRFEELDEEVHLEELARLIGMTVAEFWSDFFRPTGSEELSQMLRAGGLKALLTARHCYASAKRIKRTLRP